jgi:hypothetical protein
MRASRSFRPARLVARHDRHWPIAALLIGAALLDAGCASTRNPPRDFDLHAASFVQTPTEPPLDINGLPNKAIGTGVGAVTGFGAGSAVGLTACLASGPLVLVCLAAVMPAAAVIGAVGGAGVGAARTESPEALGAKKVLLQKELATTSYQTRFVERLRESARVGYAIEMPGIGETAAARDASPALVDGARLAQAPVDPIWIVEVGLSGVSTDGKQSFALALEGRILLRRRGSDRIAYDKTFDEVSKAAFTGEEWADNDSKLLKSALDDTMVALADRMALDLRSMAPGTGIAVAK